MFLTILLQSGHNYEDLGLKSGMAILIITLFGVANKFYREKKTDLKEQADQHKLDIAAKDAIIKAKDDRIEKVINDHKADLVTSGNDYKILAEKHFSFMEQLKNIAANRGN